MLKAKVQYCAVKMEIGCTAQGKPSCRTVTFGITVICDGLLCGGGTGSHLHLRGGELSRSKEVRASRSMPCAGNPMRMVQFASIYV